jgi:hypothetical protein
MNFNVVIWKVDVRMYVVLSEAKRKKRGSFAELVVITDCVSV